MGTSMGIATAIGGVADIGEGERGVCFKSSCSIFIVSCLLFEGGLSQGTGSDPACMVALAVCTGGFFN